MKTVTVELPEAECVRCGRTESADLHKYEARVGEVASAYVGAPRGWTRLQPDGYDLRGDGEIGARAPKLLVICPSCYAIAKPMDRQGRIL